MEKRTPVQGQRMKQGTQTGALGQPGGRGEGGSGWGTAVHPWLIHVDVWEKPPQYGKVISLKIK